MVKLYYLIFAGKRYHLMKFLQNKFLHIGLFVALVIVLIVLCIQRASTTGKYKANGYDAQMWTSSSITSYHMYFNNYVRPTKELDNWFPTHAWRKGVNVFTGDSAINSYYTNTFQYNPDSIKFPMDQVTVRQKKTQYTLAIKYDTLKFPRKDFQWFDRATWTFGWKAPNLGKYIMGCWIQTFAKTKPDPKGYFEFYVPANVSNPDSGSYTPSTQVSPAPYSYAPIEYERLARQPNILMTVICVIAVIVIGWLFFDFWVGFIAGLWLTLNSTFLDINCAVGLDSFSTSFTTLSFLSLLATVRLILKNEKWWKIIVLGIITGISSAFAVSSKLNSAMIVFVEGSVLGVLAVIAIWNALKLKQQTMMVRLTPLLKISVAGIITIIITVSLFIRLNPQVQKQPMQRISAMRSSIDEYFDRRARIFTQNQFNDKLKTIGDALMILSKTPGVDMQQLAAINQQATVISQSMNQEVQKSAIGDNQKENDFYLHKFDKYIKDISKVQLQLKKMDSNYELKNNFINWVRVKHSWPVAFGLVTKRIAMVDAENPDRYYGTFGKLLNVKYNFLDGLFALLGLVFCIVLAVKQWREKKQFYAYGALFIAAIFIIYGNTDFIWQDWPRYFTPIFPVYALLIAIGIVEGIKFISKRSASKKNETSPKTVKK